MTKQEHLKIAELCFSYMRRNLYNKRDWFERVMYENLFSWAGWEEE